MSHDGKGFREMAKGPGIPTRRRITAVPRQRKLHQSASRHFEAWIERGEQACRILTVSFDREKEIIFASLAAQCYQRNN